MYTNQETNSIINNQQTMSSLEIAELTGKQHKNIMQAIRNMEPAWEKVNGLKFQLVDYKDKKGEVRPCYLLTKTECLYVATKFNDEARAKLVLRWEELERAESEKAKIEIREKVQLKLPSKEEIVLTANQIIGEEVRLANEDTKNCLSATDVAKLCGMSVKRFNKMLVGLGIQKKRNGCFHLDENYEGYDFTKYRLHRYYSKEGPVKDIIYMVWTPEGVEWLKKILGF